ncbi:unnamed protein product [Staurois parvus]|uniref:Uncharacterized protein n=1 Tax=Staurois parvus TaxID=386267 RepID=A0ABN9AIF9_9NEOB|nr:unnamed protein product [Staurois parvus]
MILHFVGGGLFCLLTVLLPVSSTVSCTAQFRAVHSTAIQSSVITVKHTDTAP